MPVRSLRRLRRDPAFGKAAVDDRVLDVLDRDRRIGDAQHAGAFARGRAGAAGELGEVVRLVQPVERVLPAALVNEVVPLGNEVVDRAARFALAERHAAIHAAGALRAQVQLGRRGEDFQEIFARSSGSRYGTACRSNSLKPVGLPMAAFNESDATESIERHQ